MAAQRPNTEEPTRRSSHRADRSGWPRGWGFPGVGLLCLLADLIRQPRDLTQAAHAILKILPEGPSQPPGRLLQTRKRGTRTSPQLSAGAAADLPLLHVIPDVPLAQVVVQ